MLHFPFGCIEEDIVIYMFIPEEYAELDDENSEVSFEDEIITGVKFSVMPVDSESIEEPYYFKKPVILSLVFKKGLLDSLGVNPENLDVFFADNTGFVQIEDSENVVVDTVRNKIYSSIEHFSTIVVRQKNSDTGVEDLNWTSENEIRIYPNPFNSSTNIRFHLSEETEVKLAVYNIFGQQIKQLVNEVKSEGSYVVNWNGTNETGTRVPTGIYLCRMLKKGMVTSVTRVVLNR